MSNRNNYKGGANSPHYTNSSKIQGGREASCVPALKPMNTSGKAKTPMSTIVNPKMGKLGDMEHPTSTKDVQLLLTCKHNREKDGEEGGTNLQSASTPYAFTK